MTTKNFFPETADGHGPEQVLEPPSKASNKVKKVVPLTLGKDANMTDFEYHARLAREQRDATMTEREHKRYSTVGHLALMAAEQAIEALASREGKHFHERLRDAHQKRLEWVATKYPDLSSGLKRLWGIRAELGYGGANGDRAMEAVTIMEEIFNELRI